MDVTEGKVRSYLLEGSVISSTVYRLYLKCIESHFKMVSKDEGKKMMKSSLYITCHRVHLTLENLSLKVVLN